jgi:hypothetical protein
VSLIDETAGLDGGARVDLDEAWPLNSRSGIPSPGVVSGAADDGARWSGDDLRRPCQRHHPRLRRQRPGPPGVVALPLTDGPQVRTLLVWRADDENPIVRSLIDLATHSTRDVSGPGTAH